MSIRSFHNLPLALILNNTYRRIQLLDTRPPETPLSNTPSTNTPSPIVMARETFNKFFALPLELRHRIYTHALHVGQPINPHLCEETKSGIVKFHDKSTHSLVQPYHAFINTFLGVTQASKELRAESLPVFYSCNTFYIGSDTATYFTYLEHLGRLKHIQHVHYLIQMRSEANAAITLVQMSRHIRKVQTYESQGNLKCLSIPGRAHKALTEHPEYNVCGLAHLPVFICLRKLIAGYSSNKLGFRTKLAVPLPRKEILERDPRFKWFLAVAEGLGIEVCLVDDNELVDFSTRLSLAVMEWRKGLQKLDGKEEKEGVKKDIPKDGEQAKRSADLGSGGNLENFNVNKPVELVSHAKPEADIILEKTREMFDSVDNLSIPPVELFLREECDHDGVRWFRATH